MDTDWISFIKVDSNNDIQPHQFIHTCYFHLLKTETETETSDCVARDSCPRPGSVAFYGMLDLDFPVYADWGAPNTGGGGGGGRGGDGGRGGGRGGRGRGRGGGGGGGRGDRQRGGDGARERDANGTSKRKREDGDDASERPHKSIPSETPDASMRDEGAVNSGAVGDAGTRRVRWGDDSVPNSPAGSNATAPPVMERLSEH